MTESPDIFGGSSIFDDFFGGGTQGGRRRRGPGTPGSDLRVSLKLTLEEVSNARSQGITISLIGINLDKKGKELAEKIVELGEGRLYVIRSLDEVDQIVLEDYYSIV